MTFTARLFSGQQTVRVYWMTVTLKSTSHWPQSPREQSERALELRGELEGRVQIRPWGLGWFICFGIFSKADIKQSKTFFEGHVNVAAQSAIRVLSLITHTEHPHKSFQAHLCRGASKPRCRVKTQQRPLLSCRKPGLHIKRAIWNCWRHRSADSDQDVYTLGVCYLSDPLVLWEKL